jgi:hypothetical protein
VQKEVKYVLKMTKQCDPEKEEEEKNQIATCIQRGK